MSPIAVLALAAGVGCALAPLAQAARISMTGSAHDVSLIWLGLYGFGSGVWLLYGAVIGSLPLIVSQAIALVSIATTLALAVRRRSDSGPGAPRRGVIRSASSSRQVVDGVEDGSEGPP